MGKVSFFTMLLDDNMSWWERDAINSAHERADAALDAASMQGQAFSRSIVGMQKVIQQQATQIRMLNAAVQTLAAVLRDTNLVDPELLDARLEAAIVNTEEEVARAAATGPQSMCLRCSATVPTSRTVVTETGTLCDSCHARGG